MSRRVSRKASRHSRLCCNLRGRTAGTLEAHEAEEGHVQAAAAHGVGRDEALLRPAWGRVIVGPAVTRADGRAPAAGSKGCENGTNFSLSARSRCRGPATARPGEPGVFPLDAQVNLLSAATRTSCKSG